MAKIVISNCKRSHCICACHHWNVIQINNMHFKNVFSPLNVDSLHFDCRDMHLLLHSLSFQFTNSKLSPRNHVHRQLCLTWIFPWNSRKFHINLYVNITWSSLNGYFHVISRDWLCNIFWVIEDWLNLLPLYIKTVNLWTLPW